MTQAPRASDRLASRIMWGMVIGILLGVASRIVMHFSEACTAPLNWLAVEAIDPFGQIFLRMLFFVIVPLVFASLALGIVQLGRLDRLGLLAGRTFLVFGFNMAVGVAIGLTVMNTVQPGRRLAPETKAYLMEQANLRPEGEPAREALEPRVTFRELVDRFMPKNLIGAVADFQILPVILFAILVGAAATQMAEVRRLKTREGLEIVTEIMVRIVHLAMKLAPYAVAAMICSLVLKAGLDILRALSVFVLCVLGGIALHLVGTMSFLLKCVAKRSPVEFFRAIRAVLVTAFSTSSSSATLPTSIMVSRENLGVSASTAGFVLPMGATMNMSGTALYEGCVVLFVAQVYDIPLSLGGQATLVLLAVLSAVAVAGIPGGAIPLIMGLLAGFGIPPEGVVIVLGVERILDMARTTLNVSADVVTACVVDRWTGAERSSAGARITHRGSGGV